MTKLFAAQLLYDHVPQTDIVGTGTTKQEAIDALRALWLQLDPTMPSDEHETADHWFDDVLNGDDPHYAIRYCDVDWGD